MNPIELIVLNFEEVRRRSIKVWSGIPQDQIFWKPDENAMSCIDMVRHVLESEYYYHQIILNRGSFVEYPSSPFASRPLDSVEDEVNFSQSYRVEFMEMINKLTPEDLGTIQIDRSDVGYSRSLGDMLLRVAYHESVHTGQILQYLRMMNVERPDVWD